MGKDNQTKWFPSSHQSIDIQALSMSSDSFLPLISAASHPRGVFDVCCGQKQVLGKRVDVYLLLGAS